MSVILSTRNHAGRLALTLESFSRLFIPSGTDWEIVVANNGSTDRTDEVLQAWTSRLPLHHTWVPEPGLSRGRNAALARARGELVLFTDDDVSVPPEWLATYVRVYRQRGKGYYYGGPVLSDFEGAPPSSAWLRFAPPSVRGLDWGPTEREIRRGEYFIGPNWASPADAVRLVGGFDIRMGLGCSDGPQAGEETDLMRRLSLQGQRGWYVPDARLRHWVPAHKTREEHIKTRWELRGSVMAWTGRAGEYHAFRLNRVPWRVYPALVAAFLRRLAASIGIGDQVAATAEYLLRRGVWNGFRLPSREPGAGSSSARQTPT